MDDRILTFEPNIQRQITGLLRDTFAQEDDVLATVRRNIESHNLPMIQIRPEEGQILMFLAALIGARRILEIGTLAGYSGIWLARALPEGGKLITLERESQHAALSREHFALAGLNGRIELIEGDAHETLKRLDGGEPFDMVFIDADKTGYPAYLEWSLKNVRSGGLITGHNAFRGGKLVETPPDDATVATLDLLNTMARHERLLSTVIPVGDGIAAALVR